MENLIGKKVIGFKFEDNYNIFFDERMNNYIGQVGEIDDIYDSIVDIRFEDNLVWSYPLELIEDYLVDEPKELVEEESKSGWYRDSDIPKWLCYRDYESDRIYGFNLNNNWFCDTQHKHEKGLTLHKEYKATDEEVIERLTEEAKRRGLVVGKKIKCLDDGEFWEPQTEHYYIGERDEGFVFGLASAIIMKNGVWTEPTLDNLKPLFKGLEMLKEANKNCYYFYHSERHGPNFYTKEEVPFHDGEDWKEDLVVYTQLGSGKKFVTTKERFKKFKEVWI